MDKPKGDGENPSPFLTDEERKTKRKIIHYWLENPGPPEENNDPIIQALSKLTIDVLVRHAYTRLYPQ